MGASNKFDSLHIFSCGIGILHENWENHDEPLLHKGRTRYIQRLKDININIYVCTHLHRSMFVQSLICIYFVINKIIVKMRRINRTIQEEIFQFRNLSWNNYLVTIEKGPSLFWNIKKLLRKKSTQIPTLINNGIPYTSCTKKIIS